MGKILLSIDWDYFIPINKEWCSSYIENKKNIISLWYKRYIENKIKGKNIEHLIDVSPETYLFWNKLKKYFKIHNSTKVYISDSHKFSYIIAKKHNCSEVFSFDAHSDLGYSGINSLDFKLNCSNWLGKLLKDNYVKKATIIYSPYTYENKEDFKEFNEKFNINYIKFQNLPKNIDISVIHICRSGAWTPPWLDFKFYKFINELNLKYKIINCPNRKWNTKNIDLASQINYLLCS
ncbi:arginase [Caminicella sporogenes]|uniref:arginase n=1 Tax=Caminicella sporogenes TaxID=166485 RepID=UPI0025401434|nr:arginase [Caminicella sporogenes]WIF94109.1 arginase [Caminicella sporogenes]